MDDAGSEQASNNPRQGFGVSTETVRIGHRRG